MVWEKANCGIEKDVNDEKRAILKPKPLEGMTWTARKVASWVGTLMWKTRIAGDSLSRMRKEIDLVKWARIYNDLCK